MNALGGGLPVYAIRKVSVAVIIIAVVMVVVVIVVLLLVAAALLPSLPRRAPLNSRHFPMSWQEAAADRAAWAFPYSLSASSTGRLYSLAYRVR